MSTVPEEAPGPAATAVQDSPNASPPASRRVHFPGLEGLRAAAACAVVLHHSVSAAWPQYGALPLSRTPLLARFAHVTDGGVAVFFVLSGFLIYRPFVAAHLAGRPQMPAKRFFWRRLLRIAPAYWLALSFFWAIGQYDLGGPGTAWRYYAFGQIYSRSTVLGGIVPAWSLNTEISFYLLVPALAWALGRVAGRWGRSAADDDGRVRRRAVVELVAVSGLVVSGYIARGVVSSADPSWRPLSFNWLLTNIDFFAAGMVVAVLSAWAHARPDRLAWTRQLGRSPELSWVIAVGVFAWFAIRIGPAHFTVGYRGGYWQLRAAVLTVVSLLVLVPSAFGNQERGPVRAALRWGPVHWVGVVSYGFYLWHLPFLDRLSTHTNALTGKVMWRGWVSGQLHLPQSLLVAFVLGLGAAAVSYYLMERPLQRFKDRF